MTRSSFFQPVLALWRVNVLLYLRNRKAMLINVLVPILIAAFFGSLFGGGGGSGKAKFGVVDEDQSVLSQALAHDLATDDNLTVQVLDRAQAETLVRKGKLSAAIVIGKGFGQAVGDAVLGGPKPELLLWVDPSDTIIQGLAQGLLSQYVMKEALSLAFVGPMANERLQAFESALATDTTLPPEQRTALSKLMHSLSDFQQLQAQSEPNTSENANASAPTDTAKKGNNGFSLPFVLHKESLTASQSGYNSYAHSFAGMGVQFVLMMAVDMGVALLLIRRSGLWQRLRSSPLTRAQLLTAHFLSTTLIASAVLAVVMIVGMAVFGFRAEGSWLGWALIIVAFGAFTAAFGLLLAAIGRDPDSTRGLAIMASLLLVMLGGAWVPSFVFPAWLQQLTLFIPVRHAVDGFDAVLWRGQGLEAAGLPVVVLLGSAAALLALAVWRFRWSE